MDDLPHVSKSSRILPNPDALMNDTFWRNLIYNMPAHLQIIEGGLYLFERSTSILHQNRKLFPHKAIITTDGRLLFGNIIRCLGMVPEKFKDQLPDSANWIDRKLLHRIREKNEFECQKIGCYDRYRCFWYHKDKMETSGPWNKIPSWYKPGIEECPLFIDKINPLQI